MGYPPEVCQGGQVCLLLKAWMERGARVSERSVLGLGGLASWLCRLGWALRDSRPRGRALGLPRRWGGGLVRSRSP